jgi:dihydropteroate synthase
MGILNVTPDSFFDGGKHSGKTRSEQRVDELIAEGADIIDIGGESTRPGAAVISPEEQIERIEPAVRYAIAQRATVSVDTSNAEVAAHALGLGAQIVNDVSCLENVALAKVVASHGATLILMHSRGSMLEMQGFSKYPENGYKDVIVEVRDEWRRARDRALQAGVILDKIWFDPGLGFQKSARHSLTLLARLDSFVAEGAPVVVGASRKSFIASADGTPPEERLGGSIAACIYAMKRGASVLRVHDVQQTLQALRLTAALEAATQEKLLD